MKATIGCEASISRIYPHSVFKALSESGLQHYAVDNDYFAVLYNGVWMHYDKVSKQYPFLGLPVLDLESLETSV